MRTRQRFRTVYKKLISSYIIVLCFTIFTVAVILHSYSSKLLKNEMINFGGEVILRIAESLDRQVFNCVERTWVECAVNDTAISSAISNGGTMTHYNYYLLCTQLAKLTNANKDVISSIDLYVSDSQVLISSSNLGKIKFINGNIEMIPEEFRDIVQRGEVGSGWLTAKDNLMYFYRTVPYIKGSNIPFKGYIAIHVKAEAINNILKSEQSQKAYFTLVDSDGKILLSSSDVVPGKNTVSEILNSESRNYYSDTDGYIVNAAKLSSSSIYLIRMVPNSVFFNKLSNMRFILWILCFVFVLIGFGISMIFARQIYNPIERIVNNIRNFTEFESDRHSNEYSIIDGTISTLSDKISNLESEIVHNRQLLKNKDVIALLAGHEVKSAELTFKYRNFAAVAVLLMPICGDVSEVAFKISSVLENGGDGVEFYFASTVSDRIDVVANFDRDKYDLLCSLVRKIADAASAECDVVAAIGEKCDYDDIAKSYAGAVKCLQYKYFTQDKVLISYEYLYRELSNEKFSDGNIRNFKAMLASGNDEKIYKSVDILIDEILNSNCSYKQGRGRVYSIFSVFFNYVLEENKNPLYAVTEETYAELSKCSTVMAFGDWLKNEIGQLLLDNGAETHITNSDMISAAKHIIDENLDKDISLCIVADKLYIAPSYLSRIFKSETGENFNSYITNRRLELARKLIIETNYSVNVITRKTGFNSATYLIKCFKKKYGQTPVNYKKNYIIEQNGGKKSDKEV